MTRTQQMIVAFWVFIICMLLWQFYSYNSGLDQKAKEHPQQTHFFFYKTNAPAAAPVQTVNPNADVKQTSFVVQDNTPSPGNFTCLVTLKNVGGAKATGVQVHVRPYRGVSNYDPDAGHQTVVEITDDDPLSKYGDWISFPDLAPGESSTQSTTFLSRNDFHPGINPSPEILFESEKTHAKPSARGGGD